LRRVFALLLVTPLLASCSDSVTPVAPVPSEPPHALMDESPVVVAEPLSPGWTDSALDEWTLDDWTAGAEVAYSSPLESAPGTGAVMEFGHPGAGAPFPLEHDESFHAADKVYPGTVVVDAFQPVIFKVAPGHRVAIYKPGKRPQDVVPGNGFFILDENLRKALQAAPVPVISFIFAVPGRYLVICATRRHFVDANMYGWVIVR
jgi:hypothetical protein